VYELLARQFEVAKIDEAKESAVVQVLDQAIEPDFKAGPKRLLIVLVMTFAAFALAVLIALMLEVVSGLKRDPRKADRLYALKRSLSWRRTAPSRDDYGRDR
jgi:uncharacterized protein involved in exopolysaccharide biosynthesis